MHLPDRTLTEEARRTLAEFEAARVRQAADRASSQKRGIVIAGISLKLGLALLCLGILAISTDSCESTLRSVSFALDKSTGAPNLTRLRLRPTRCRRSFCFGYRPEGLRLSVGSR